MEQLDSVNIKLQTALNNVDRDRAAEIQKLNDEEQRLRDRLRDLEGGKLKAAASNGNLDVSDDDIMEINAGGKIVAAKRGTLCRWKGTRFEALFSGRWDNKTVRDSNGRIFLDINGDCFQAIVDYMTELVISTEEDPPEYPIVNEEYEQQFQYQLRHFGLSDPAAAFGSEIIKRFSHGYVIHQWLREDGSDGVTELIYCSSRDGLSSEAFHDKCDRRGPTLVVIETTEGVVGGYTNTSWQRMIYSSQHASANKAFLFALSGFGISSPRKMELKNKDDNRAIDNKGGPAFGGKDADYSVRYNCREEKGHDLIVSDSTLTLNTGTAYACGPASMTNNRKYAIKSIEVFSVRTGEPFHLDPRTLKQRSSDSVKNPPTVNRFTKEVNEAINEKWQSLNVLEEEVLSLEESYEDEQHFIQSLALAGGEVNDIITLNVSGTMMATKRATLMVAEDSVLAQQFDDTKWTMQGNNLRVKEWTPDDVTNWVNSIEGITECVAGRFWENKINGPELLTLNEFGLERMGVKRIGTICRLLDEIKSLKEKANQDEATLIEHSPYCFGKILDYLRLKRLHSVDLAEEPALPIVCDSQKKRFEKVVKYYFPGESSSFVLGSPLEP